MNTKITIFSLFLSFMSIYSSQADRTLVSHVISAQVSAQALSLNSLELSSPNQPLPLTMAPLELGTSEQSIARTTTVQFVRALSPSLESLQPRQASRAPIGRLVTQNPAWSDEDIQDQRVGTHELCELDRSTSPILPSVRWSMTESKSKKDSESVGYFLWTLQDSELLRRNASVSTNLTEGACLLTRATTPFLNATNQTPISFNVTRAASPVLNGSDRLFGSALK